MKDYYRHLTIEEIEKLNGNNCSCESWNLVLVKNGFDPSYIRNSLFSGNIRLGVFTNCFELDGGFQKHSGIYNAIIHNCTIGDQVLIENIQGYIGNYDIGEGSIIQNVNSLVVTRECSFGNGTRVSVLDETGGRNIAIYNELSSYFAYAYVLYRYRPSLIGAMENIVKEYSDRVSSDRGFIGNNVVIKNSECLQDVNIGDCCIVDGATRLTNGSINSNKFAPIYIGCKVVASDFIISSGSSVDEGSIISRCFIGQSCKIGHAYYNYNGCKIKLDALKKGQRLYHLAVKKYFGDCLVRRFERGLPLETHITQGDGLWIDMSGLITPRKETGIIFSAIENRQLMYTEDIHSAFMDLHNRLDEYEWNWAYRKMKKYFHLDSSSQKKDNVKIVLSEWLESSIELDNLICEDAKKEYGPLSVVGFGIDGFGDDSKYDIDAVRGSYNKNSFILHITD